MNAAKWDKVFGAFGGRIFTIGALLASVAVTTISVIIAPQLFDLPTSYCQSHHGDIDAFIRAGELAAANAAAAAYDPAIFRAPFTENSGLLWFYPPHAFFAVMPLGALPFAVVRPLWIALTLLSMIAVVRIAGFRKLLPIVIVTLSPAVFASLYFLQVGAFIAIGLAASLLLAPSRPIAAGIFLGLMTVKPQYGLLIPVLLAAFGIWRTFAAAAATSLLLVALSILVFGASSWSAYFASLTRDQAPFFAIAQPATASVGQLAIKLGVAPTIAVFAQFVAILAAAALVSISGKKADYRVAAGLTVILSLAAAPSSWTYDWPILAAGLAMIAAARGAWPWPLQALALAAWVAPFAHFFAISTLAAPMLLLALSAAMSVLILNSCPLTDQSAA